MPWDVFNTYIPADPDLPSADDHFVVTESVDSTEWETNELTTAAEIAESYEYDNQPTVPETPNVWEEYDGQQTY